jgi:tetratricopeptide (TPR) repeat protein
MAKTKGPRKDMPERLPQVEETWRLAVREMSSNFDPGKVEAWRPVVFIIADDASSEIYHIAALPEHPTTEQARYMLLDCMCSPPNFARQIPRRPSEVIFEDSQLFHELKPTLHEIGVAASLGPASEAMSDIVDELEGTLEDLTAEPPGLLSVEGTTPRMIADLYEAAASFYRAAPWKRLDDTQTLAVHIGPGTEEGFIQLMGSGGMEFGFIYFSDWEDLANVFRHANDLLPYVPEGGFHSLSFGNDEESPSEDVEATRKYGWKLASHRAYPMPMIFKEDDTQRPSRDELIHFEALLRAIPIFVREHLQPDGEGDYRPAQANLNVKTHDGPLSVNIRYPASEVALMSLVPEESEEDWEEENWEDEEWVNEDETGLQISEALREAQELADRAWDEDDLQKRVRLARQAIKTSPDCADAYTILGDEADTSEKAQGWYQKGMEAGERVLGRSYMEDHEGELWFWKWGRPYLRARRGLADVLLEQGELEQALAHYQELLNLDDEDILESRQPLLFLLLTMGQNDEAAELLDEFSDDMSCDWLYGQALLTFRQEGDTSMSRAARREAVRYNPHVPAYLSGEKHIPGELPEDEDIGDENEAIHYAAMNHQNWWSTPGAIQWLKKGAKTVKK